MSSNFKNVGKLIASHRTILRFSQEELSHFLGYKNGQFISNVERGKCAVPYKKLAIMCDKLNLSFVEYMRMLSKDHYDLAVRVTNEQTKYKVTEVGSLIKEEE